MTPGSNKYVKVSVPLTGILGVRPVCRVPAAILRLGEATKIDIQLSIDFEKEQVGFGPPGVAELSNGYFLELCMGEHVQTSIWCTSEDGICWLPLAEFLEFVRYFHNRNGRIVLRTPNGVTEQ